MKIKKSLWLRLFVLLLSGVLLIVLPLVKIQQNNDYNYIYNHFVGAKCEYQGIIEIWNIDTFESGSVSKTSLIAQFAEDFKKKNKGLHFMIRNLTETECVNLLKNGEVPDLFSCSYGVAEVIESYVQNFSIKFNLYDNFVDAGSVDGKLYAVAWCMNNYYLFSTKSNLEKAKVENFDDLILSKNIFSLGYSVQKKNGTRNVYSVDFGIKNYLLPLSSVVAYNGSGENNLLDLSYNKEQVLQTQYSAYCNFLAGNSVMLLGSARDVVRLKNREKLGKITDVVYEPLTGFSDMIQFMFLAKFDDKIKQKVCEKFVQFMTEDKSQKLVMGSGMFPVIKYDFDNQNLSAMQHIILDKIENYTFNDVFISKSSIQNLQP